MDTKEKKEEEEEQTTHFTFDLNTKRNKNCFTLCIYISICYLRFLCDLISFILIFTSIIWFDFVLDLLCFLLLAFRQNDWTIERLNTVIDIQMVNIAKYIFVELRIFFVWRIYNELFRTAIWMKLTTYGRTAKLAAYWLYSVVSQLHSYRC